MLIPNPILFGPTPAGGAVLPVTADRGGLAGYVLLGLSGPAATVEVGTAPGEWRPVRYPHVLASGEQVRLTRSDPSATMTTLRMLAPIDDGPIPENAPAGPSNFPKLSNGVPVTTTVLSPQEPTDPITIYEVNLPPGVPELRATATGSSEVLVALTTDPSLSGPPEADAQPGSDPTTVRLSEPVEGVWYVVCIATGGASIPGVTITATWDDGGGDGVFAVQTDPEGYQIIEGAEAEADPEGYQTIQGAAATADADGYETVERS